MGLNSPVFFKTRKYVEKDPFSLVSQQVLNLHRRKSFPSRKEKFISLKPQDIRGTLQNMK